MSSKLVECFVYASYRAEWPCCPDGHPGHDGSREVGQQQPIHHILEFNIQLSLDRLGYVRLDHVN
jgi:hypothetical protein